MVKRHGGENCTLYAAWPDGVTRDHDTTVCQDIGPWRRPVMVGGKKKYDLFAPDCLELLFTNALQCNGVTRAITATTLSARILTTALRGGRL